MIYIHEIKDLEYKGSNLFIDSTNMVWSSSMENVITVTHDYRNYIPLMVYLRDFKPYDVEIIEGDLCISMPELDSKGLKKLCEFLDSEDFTLSQRYVEYDEYEGTSVFAVYFKIPKALSPEELIMAMAEEAAEEQLEELNRDLDDLLNEE